MEGRAAALRSHVLGPHFEELARDFIFRFAATRNFGGQPATANPAVVNTPPPGYSTSWTWLPSAAMGTVRSPFLHWVKRSNQRQADSRRSRAPRAHPQSRGGETPFSGNGASFVFSASGFERNLTQEAAERDDVELIDLERLYSGD
jgi:hypothetical protein